jgi:RNA polymerase sigma factor (sigma-70 family)
VPVAFEPAPDRPPDAGLQHQSTMTNPPDGSVTRCIARFKAGDQDAFGKIWEHYFNDLVKVARKYLSSRPKGAMVDEDDIVQNALLSVCRGLPRNKSYDTVDSRESLWPILVAITKYKVTDHFRRERAQKRGGGRLLNELPADQSGQPDGGLANLLADQSPTADDLVAMSEQLAHLLSLLPKEDLVAVAKLHFEGYKNAEIAEQMGISLRGVERKLALVRDTWFEWWQKQEQNT